VANDNAGGTGAYRLASPRWLKRADTTWVEPHFEADIVYTEATSDGMLRHPSFKGLVSGTV
jgi:hypothetical protein